MNGNVDDEPLSAEEMLNIAAAEEDKRLGLMVPLDQPRSDPKKPNDTRIRTRG